MIKKHVSFDEIVVVFYIFNQEDRRPDTSWIMDMFRKRNKRMLKEKSKTDIINIAVS